MTNPKYEMGGLQLEGVAEVRKLLAGINPDMQRMFATQVELTRAYIAAEEKVFVEFARRNKIELPNDFTGTARRKKLMGQMELVCATRGVPFNGERRLVQESWCVDRRNGKTGFERTWPRARLYQEADGVTFNIEVADGEEGGSDGGGEVQNDGRADQRNE